MTIRKFYDVDAPVMGGVFSEIIDPAGSFKFGDKIINPKEEIKEEIPVEVAAEVPVETTETPKAEVTDTPEVKTEVKTEPVIEAKTEPKVEPQVFDWKAEIKKVDKYELLKEAGIDEYALEAIKYYEQTGNLSDYAEAKNIDFSKMSHEEIMRYNLRKEHSDLSSEELELLAEDRIRDKYRLDETVHDEREVAKGKLTLKLDAEKLRKELIEKQSKFKAPEKQPSQADAEAQRQIELDKKNYETFVESVKKSDVTNNLLKDKRLAFGEKDSLFNYEMAEPSKAVDVAINPNKLFEFLVDAKGQPDLNKVYKAYALISNMDEITSRLIEHGKTLGEKKAFVSLPGADPKKTPIAAKGEKEPKNEYEAMAMYGKWS